MAVRVNVVAHCRAGFEPECLEDLRRLAQRAGGTVIPEAAPAGLVCAAVDGYHRGRFSRALADATAIFARSILVAGPSCTFAGADRITPIVANARALAPRFSRVWLEMPDTNEGKTLSGLCKRLAPLLERALTDAGLLDVNAGDAPRLHVVFTSRDHAHVGTSDPETGSPWPMGIPRLRMPGRAPSRSTQKLAEALVTFLGEHERDLLRPGMRAVDLGAAPGGWSWQLSARGLRVTAVDNAALKGEVADDPLVVHVRDDGYAFRPRRPVDWMFCDIVDKPSRVAALVARWMSVPHARRAIFNLKLPMKKRYGEVLRCIDILHKDAGETRVRVAMRQLYHDREEVTGYVERVQ